MKVLQINCVYKKGSTGKIMNDLHIGLQDRGISSIICYGRGESCKEHNVYKVCSELEAKINNFITRLTGVMYGGCWRATWHLTNIIKKERPDIVHLQCINGYFTNIYYLVEWLKRRGIPTTVTLHAEFMYTANCGHAFECHRWITGCGKCPRMKKETKSLFFDRTHFSWLKMQKAFEGSEKLFRIVSVSPWLEMRAKNSPFLKNHTHTVIYNGINTDIFRPCDCSEIKKRLNIQEQRIILHVTASFISENKGGRFVLELAKRFDNSVLFIIIGNTSKIANLPPNVIDVGRVEKQEILSQYYSMSNLTLVTSQRETFSMVTAESLCCGTPVVGFKAGGPEQIALKEYSQFVEYGDIDSLYYVMQKWIIYQKSAITAKEAANVYSRNRMVDNYISLYNQMIGEKNND